MTEDSTTGAPQGPGDGSPPTPGPGTDAAAVAAYLAAAPPAVREWLLAQAAQPQAGSPGPTTPPDATGTPPAETDGPGIDDELDELDELGEADDDVIGARRRARVRVHGPGNPPGQAPAATATGQPGRASRWARTALVAAVVLGAGFGIWFAGLDEHPEADPGGNPSLAAGSPGDDADLAQYIADLRTAVEADPSDIDARLELGAALFNDSDLTGAKEQWDAVLALDPEQAIAWYNLGFYHMSSDPPDWDAVRASWEKVLEIDPASTMAATVQTHLDGLMAAEP